MSARRFRPADSERSATCRQGGSRADGTSVRRMEPGWLGARSCGRSGLTAARNLVCDSSPSDGLLGVSDHRAGRGLGSASSQNRWSLTPRYPLGRRQCSGFERARGAGPPRDWRHGKPLHGRGLVVATISASLFQAGDLAMLATSRVGGTPPADGVFPPCVPLPVLLGCLKGPGDQGERAASGGAASRTSRRRRGGPVVSRRAQRRASGIPARSVATGGLRTPEQRLCPRPRGRDSRPGSRLGWPLPRAGSARP